MTAKERLMAIKQVDFYDCDDAGEAIDELATRYEYADTDEERAALQSLADWLVQGESADWDTQLERASEESVQ